MNNLLKILIFFIVANPLYSQRGELPETLQEYISYAQKNSLAAKAAKSNFESRKWRYQSIKSNFLPQISFNMSAPGLIREINSITQPDGSELFREQSQLMSWGNLSVGQQIPMTGGNVSVSSGLNRIDILGEQGISVWQTTPFQLSYTQPIFQHNDMRWQQQLEAMRFLQSDNRLNEDMEDIAIQVTQKFFDLYVAEMNFENAQLNVAINDTLYQLSTGRFEVGRIAENDLLQAELNFLNSKNELENSRLTFLESMEQLKIYIGYYGGNDLRIIPPKITMDLYADYELLLDQALENRSDITSFKIQEIEADREISRAKDRNNFDANLVASFGLNQTAGAIDNAYKELLDRERINVSLEIPLFDWGRGEADVYSAMEEKNRIQSSITESKKNFEIEIKYAALRFNQMRTQVNVAAKADTIAAKRFDVAKKRYIINKIDINDLFIAQKEKDSAFRNYILTLRNYWTSYYRLRRLSLYDIVDNRKINY